jgi:hypothetical protein
MTNKHPLLRPDSIAKLTTILEFEVVAPLNIMETKGEKFSLSIFGEYCPKCSSRGYSLLYLLDFPNNYRVSMIAQKGEVYEIPANRVKPQKPLWDESVGEA